MRKIIHIDMDCFYAAVEVRDQPSLKGRPVAVGGTPEGRGVVATANYEARKFGVRSALSSAMAIKQCPKLVFIQPDFSKYKRESRKIREIFLEYTHVIEPLSLDEAYLDVSGSNGQNREALEIAREIRQRIEVERGLTASAGIAPNKMLAKIASDWNKPNGQKVILPDEVEKFMFGLPVSKIPGIGKVTAKKMQQRGVFTCGDLQGMSQAQLIDQFGKWGDRLFQLCRGQDHRKVGGRTGRKSMSVETTLAKDFDHIQNAKAKIHKLYLDLQNRKKRAGIEDHLIKGLSVKLKFHDFQQITRDLSNPGWPEEEAFIQLFEKAYASQPRPFRLLGMGLKIKSQRELEIERIQLSLPLND